MINSKLKILKNIYLKKLKIEIIVIITTNNNSYFY